ncbi:MAG TPA: ABC transporter substrate-binding protein [Syntrophorhabdales bacterium]|nr:ABC transporter substrate-binding protein [Syntrophorhabdales bacterium]
MRRIVLCFFALVLISSFAGSAKAAEPIRLGILYDASGGASDYARYNLMNAALAVEEINQAGGIMGRQVELIKEDDGNDPNVSPLRTRTLIKRGAVGIILGSGSASVLQARVVVEEEKVPAFATVLNDKVTLPPNNNYVFQTNNTVTQQTNVLILTLQSRVKEIAIFTDTSPTGSGLANLFKKALTDAGVKVLAVEAIDVGATDATAVVTRLRDKWKAPAILVSGQAPQEQALFVRTVSDIGWKVPLYQDVTAVSPSYRKLLGPKAMENLFYMEPIHPDNALAQKWIKKFEAKYPNEPVLTTMGNVWNAVYLFKAGVEKAKSTNGTAVRDAIEQICGMKSHFGPPTSTVCCSKQSHLCADPNGIFLATYKNGKSVPVK